MLIHVEWVDLCWKSTLIDKMKLILKDVMVLTTPREYLPRWKSVDARKKIWKFYIERLNEILEIFEKDPNKIIILDRFFFSELVYGKVIRKYDSEDMKKYQEEVYELLNKIHQKYGYGLIYLSDKTESIWNRFLEKGDDYVKDKKYYHNLKVEYWKRINAWERLFPVVKINVFEENDYWNRIIDQILLPNYVYKRDGQC